MKTIKERFKEFSQATIPANASDIQVTETRRAFYAGWLSAIATFTAEVATLPDKEAMKEITKLYAECQQFFVDIGTEREGR